MFACLFQPKKASSSQLPASSSELVQLARDFSPRVETHGERTVTLDVSGLGSLLGDARAIGDELRRTAADRALYVHVAIADTATAAILLAHARAGVTVVESGDEAKAVASLPLSALTPLVAGFGLQAPGSRAEVRSPESEVRKWGLRTLGDLAALPSADLSERLGQEGLQWQRWARGEDARPMVPAAIAPEFEEALDLEWPIDGLEPLSFVLARLFDPLCDRLEQHDRGAVVVHVELTLVNKQSHLRTLQLPAPMRDPRVLRMLALLDLESNPPPAGVDRVRVGVEVAEGRVLQFGLFARALPSDKLTTLLARLGALVGSDRVGAPALVDSYRPGAFAMAKFEPTAQTGLQASGSRLQARSPEPAARSQTALRRYRSPVPARVVLEGGRPVRVTTDRRGLSGGVVQHAAGPWRSSGEWWTRPWHADEWDVTLADGASYRVAQDRESQHWFVAGVID